MNTLDSRKMQTWLITLFLFVVVFVLFWCLNVQFILKLYFNEKHLKKWQIWKQSSRQLRLPLVSATSHTSFRWHLWCCSLLSWILRGIFFFNSFFYYLLPVVLFILHWSANKKTFQFSCVCSSEWGTKWDVPCLLPAKTPTSNTSDVIFCGEAQRSDRFGNGCRIMHEMPPQHIPLHPCDVSDVAVPDVDLQWAPLPKLLMTGSLSANSHLETLDKQQIFIVVWTCHLL